MKKLLILLFPLLLIGCISAPPDMVGKVEVTLKTGEKRTLGVHFYNSLSVNQNSKLVDDNDHTFCKDVVSFSFIEGPFKIKKEEPVSEESEEEVIEDGDYEEEDKPEIKEESETEEEPERHSAYEDY